MEICFEIFRPLETREAKSFNPVGDRPGKGNSRIQALLGSILDNNPHK
jgi:hypothetical protein